MRRTPAGQAGTIEHAVRCALMGMALQNHPRTVPPYLAAMGYFGYLAVTLGRPLVAGILAGGTLLLVAWRWSLGRRHQQCYEASVEALHSVQREVELNALFSGMLWLISAMSVLPLLTDAALGTYLAVIGGAVAMTVFFLSSIGRAFEILVVLQIGSLAGVALAKGPEFYPLAGLAVLYGCMVYNAAKVYRSTATLAIRGGIEAKQASLAAELANRSKTQFFVAASHDLRQPLHAMGLYAEALMDRVHDPEVTRLVRGINSSVNALDELFSELLDVSRLDTGVITPQARDFALAPLFRKLSLCYEPVAHDKGLSLRLRAGGLQVHADPVLVERILRNLVANALRCTPHGGVLVSARRQRGTVLLQVWDTGIGISAPERQRIFDAFYQVPTKAVPEQRRGLGLGLSIVQRFADLMRAPLGLRSQPGRGTVFSLTLQPASKAVLPPASALPSPGLGLGGLSRQPVWLVEDDVAVRTTVAAWLTDWGAEVSSFDVTAALARLAGTPSSPPALLIVGTGATEEAGVERVARLIDAVRRHCGRALPAIVLGAEPATRIANLDALSQWLDRPVVPHKLRALVGAQLTRAL